MAQTESVKKSSNASKRSGTTARKSSSSSSSKSSGSSTNRSSSGKSSANRSSAGTRTTKSASSNKSSTGTSSSRTTANKSANKGSSERSGASTRKTTTSSAKSSTRSTTSTNGTSRGSSNKTSSNRTSTNTKKNATMKPSNKKVATKVPKQVERHSIWEEYDFPVVREVMRWLLVAFSIILFISSFTEEGNKLIWLKKVNFGLFGWCGYVSVLLTIYLAFFVIPEIGRAKAWIRFISMLLVTASTCGMMQIFCKTPLSSETTFATYYTMGYELGGGGVFAGAMVKLLYPWLGTVGMAVLLVALIICSIVVMSQRSGMAFLRDTTSSIYENVRIDMEEHRVESEIKKQERERRREIREQKELEARVRAEEAKNQEEDFEDDDYEENYHNEKIDAKAKKNMLRQKNQEEIHSSRKQKRVAQQNFNEDDEAEWRRLEEAAALYAEQQYDDYDHNPYEEEFHDISDENNEANENGSYNDDDRNTEVEQDSYVRSAVEKIRKRMARKKELEENEQKPLMEWNDTTEDTEHHNPVDYGDGRDKYSNTSGEDDVRLAVAGTRTVVTASGKVITKESDEIPPATKKRTIPGKTKKKNDDEIENDALREQSSFENDGKEQSEQKQDIDKEGMDGIEEEYIPPKPYVFPALDLLNAGDKKSNGKSQEKELQETAEILEQTFRDFGVGVTVTNYSCGPTVTRYELEPDNGVKVSRITALIDDIKLKLAATDLRMEAPIPGKAAVGIEVPNKENSTVMFRDLVESEAFQRHPSKVAFAVGKDIGGKVIVFDIAKMPHVLIAGATGSGKSVCINTLIMSILYKAEPSEVKLIMVDPKVVELSVYNGIPHLLIPVVTDPKKAAGALNWAVAEMTRRYQMFAETATRDLAGYNRKARGIRAELEKEGLTPDKIEQEGPEILPQIVIIVDELADLMMVAPNEVEEAICRLAQLARAAGIHLVLATQRPSVNVITGLIKANVPSRIAFSVSSGVDSRTILDMNGAEKLLGKGDMLFAPFGYSKPVRVQGAFVSDAEVLNITDFIKQENEQTQQQEKSMKVDLTIDNAGEKEVDSDRDEYFEKAGYFLIEKEKGSIGMLQRMFKIGFNRAARIMEQLAEAGVVGPEEGTKPRKILMTKEEFQEFVENN